MQNNLTFNLRARRLGTGQAFQAPKWALLWPACLLVAWAVPALPAQENLLRNPGFEESARQDGAPPNWERIGEGAARITVTDKEAHEGRQSVLIPAQCAAEQRIENVPAGAYMLRCWVKSESEQTVTLVLQDPDRPWEAYACAEIKAPKEQWTQLEAFCAVDQKGTLTVAIGGMSKQFRLYHGVAGEMNSPILLDACELVRYEAAAGSGVMVWDAKKEIPAGLDWSARDKWFPVHGQSYSFTGAPVLQARHLAGTIRSADGALVLSSIQGQTLKERAILVPSLPLKKPRCTLLQADGRTGLGVASGDGERSYTLWLTGEGLLRIEAKGVPRFQMQSCRLRYGLLPSFVGADICYDPQKLADKKQIALPSTQWFVGLVDGQESMLVAVWETEAQAVSLGLSGEGENRLFDTFSVATDKAGFWLSFVEHPDLWHKEALEENWLGEYIPIAWKRPFPARWMGEFFVTTGGRPYFGEPYMQYSFPVADAKTRMWGVWFEGWNHYPFFFDGAQTIVHFEKGFVPKGDALVYFLEPAAADLYSPCEIVRQALGREKAAALFELAGNGLRQLTYSTPNEFMYDRPVCATTTRLSGINQNERNGVGINLATHLYEFIREIRKRVSQYVSFFDQMQNYLDAEEKSHPELHPYLSELEELVAQAKPKSAEIYTTPLSAVEEKTEAMKKRLLAGKGDGFDCGNLDVRDIAGAQDDLCRHYSRLVMRLSQTAALKCGDAPEEALIAKHIWDQSRMILYQPVRWESRRTLYFFEP